MTEESSFHMSQGYDVLPPRTRKAYPILCAEWDHLKKNIGSISDKPNIYYIIGSILLGACSTTLIAILTGNFPNPDPETVSSRLIIAWAVVVVTLVVGGISFHFAREQRKVTQMKASDVLSQMELIEKRYETEMN